METGARSLLSNKGASAHALRADRRTVARRLSALAITGNAPVALTQGRHAVMITGSRGTFCTGAAIARDLVLTAAHCVLPGASYKLIEFDAARQPKLLDIRDIARHPNFNLQSLLGHRATADVALIKLAAPLTAGIIPATLDRAERKPQPGDRYTVTGYGLAVRGDGKTGGTLRAAQLVATGKPGNLQIRLVDPATNGASARTRCLHRRLRRAGLRRDRADRRGELVNRPQYGGRLRRADWRDAAQALPRLDH